MINFFNDREIKDVIIAFRVALRLNIMIVKSTQHINCTFIKSLLVLQKQFCEN